MTATHHISLLSGLGAALAMGLSAMGSAAASPVSAAYAILSTQGLPHSFIPVVISGVLAIYGLIVAVLIVSQASSSSMTLDDDAHGDSYHYTDDWNHLFAGLAVGLSCFASGVAISSFMGFYIMSDEQSAVSSLLTPSVFRNHRNLLQERRADKMYLKKDDDVISEEGEGSTSSWRNTTDPLLSPLRRNTDEPLARPMTIKAIMMLCFCEALGLYGLIVALMLLG